MIKIILLLLSLFIINCSLLERRDLTEAAVAAPPKADDPKRVTRRSLEDESMLGEASGSLWVNRGQASYLFANNNQRLLGDLLNIKIDGYPKEQVQTKVNVIAKLLAQILNDQRQDIKLKQDELQKQEKNINTPVIPKDEKTKVRAPAQFTAGANGSSAEENDESALGESEIKAQRAEHEKKLRLITDEQEEIQNLQKAKEFPIRSVPTRITDVLKDGSYKVRGEHPFMIGKREYKLVVGGLVKPEDFDEKGISAEALLDPSFDIMSEKKGTDL